MKKAFTLVELLVVVVVIAILSSIVFRLGGIAGDSSKRTATAQAMQRLENAISGYFAAFGSYPPVPLQGRSRNIYYKVNLSGIQQVSKAPDTTIDLSENGKGWDQVEAACRAQPVAVRYPYPAYMNEYLAKVSKTLVNHGHTDMIFDGYTGQISSDGQKLPDWTDTQMFQFGLLSFLLPRYLVMMGYDGDIYDKFKQWGQNNEMPCKFVDGTQYDYWQQIDHALAYNENAWAIAAIPSQAITARWLPNFEIPSDRGENGRLGMLIGGSCVPALYGIHVCDGTMIGVDNPPGPKDIFAVNSQAGANASKEQPYVLEKLECPDGWGNDLYYYSPPPYQGYRLWSAGPNGKTFPPWFPDEEIKKLGTYEKNVRNALADDIVHMSN